MIPPVAHFIWYGDRFPWVNVLAIRSACDRGDFERVVLHHERDLSRTPHWGELERLDNFFAYPLDPPALFERAGVEPSALADLHRDLEAPNARANMVRAAVLAAEGGVYLDCDTVTIRSLRPLLNAGVFCGEEPVVDPAARRHDRGLAARLRRWGLVELRNLCRVLPQGWRTYRRVEHLYPRAVNNAVLGATPGHPFIRGLLSAMLEVPPERRRAAFALGTHLLQGRVAAYREDDLTVHPPEVFFPLGPAISQHWFRTGRDVELDAILSDQTRVVHWYASVRTKHIVPKIDPDYVRAHAHHQPFSALARPYA